MSRNATSGPVVWLITILATCVTLYICQGILWLVVPILFAVIFYYVTVPLVNRLTLHGWRRENAAGIVMTLLMMVAAALMIISVVHLSRKVDSWNKAKGQTVEHAINNYVNHGLEFINSTVRTVTTHVPYMKNLGLTQTNGDLSEPISSWMAQHGSDTLVHALHWLPSLLLVPYLTYFILVDGSKFKIFLMHSIPNAYFEKSLLLFHEIDHQVRHYFQGLIALTALDTLALGGGLWLMGISPAFLIGLVVAMLSWIPYIGSVVGCILVVLVAATDYSAYTWMTYAAVALFLGVRLLDDFVFMPLTIGRSLKIHPVVTVLMIFIGGAVAGISGLLLVLPVLGVMMVLGQILGQLAKDERLYARYQHARRLQRSRAQKGLLDPGKV